jgi:anti-anti-sigma regulatory factor
LTIRVSTEAGETVTTVRIEGKLTSSSVPDVRAVCESAKPPLRLDLSGLYPADSDGIRALRSLSETGSELHGASPYISQLLRRKDKWCDREEYS